MRMRFRFGKVDFPFRLSLSFIISINKGDEDETAKMAQMLSTSDCGLFPLFFTCQNIFTEFHVFLLFIDGQSFTIVIKFSVQITS